jgi:hypothetical protein
MIVLHLSPLWPGEEVPWAEISGSSGRVNVLREERVYLQLQEASEGEGLMYGLEVAAMNARGVFAGAFGRLGDIFSRYIELGSLRQAFTSLKIPVSSLELEEKSTRSMQRYRIVLLIR